MNESLESEGGAGRALCSLILLLAASTGIMLMVGGPGPMAKSPDSAKSGQPLSRNRPLSLRTSTNKIRSPTTAGSFYPADPKELYRQVSAMLAADPSVGLRNVRAILVPHAGYIYSGAIAATSFREVGRSFRRVFLLAANHNAEANFKGVSIPDVSHYAIPGAEIPLSSIADELLKDPLFKSVPKAHTMHVLEAELPFLQQLRDRANPPDFTIVPMIAGRLSASDIDHLAQLLAHYADDETLMVFSVDLSHFYPGPKARDLDKQTINCILSQDRDCLQSVTTDGNQVLATMLELARRRGWEPNLLAYRNSGDVTGDPSRVVGYSAMAFAPPVYLSEAEGNDLLELAWETLRAYVEKGETASTPSQLLERHPIYRIQRGVFVTLKKDGQLRGCIGHIRPQSPLHQAVRECAISAATRDPRFPPVTVQELPDLSLSISILSFPKRLLARSPKDYPSLLRPGIDGVILIHEGRQSTYLPQVWETLAKPRLFLSRLCRKQGSPAGCWASDKAKLLRYTAYEIGPLPPRLMESSPESPAP